jgi:shikimate kinase
MNYLMLAYCMICLSYLSCVISFFHHSPTLRKCRSLFETDSETDELFKDLKIKLKGTCVYFVGMMGSGKSSVGNIFAQQLGYRFLDTDTIAEYMIEMPISDFFQQGREAEFRQTEYQVLMELAQYTRVVVATGGGCVLKNENWGFLRHGVVVYLNASMTDIYSRLSNNPNEINKRPLLRESDPISKLEEIYESRREKYEQADVIVACPGSLLRNLFVFSFFHIR